LKEKITIDEAKVMARMLAKDIIDVWVEVMRDSLEGNSLADEIKQEMLETGNVTKESMKNFGEIIDMLVVIVIDKLLLKFGRKLEERT